MGSAAHRLLRSAVACLLLAEAWSHFFWETPYRAALEAHPGVASWLGIEPEAGERVVLGFGIWFLLAGVVTVVWRPAWLGRSVAVLALLPAALSFTARVAISPDPWLVAVTQGWELCAILALAISVERHRGPAQIPLQAGLAAAFGSWSLHAFGIGAETPAQWLTWIQAIWPGGGGDATHLRILAGLTLGACFCIWIRALVPAAALILSLAGLAAVVTPVVAHLDSGAFEILHRWIPAAVGRMGLVLLPVMMAVNGGSAPSPPAPRRLKRIDLPPEETELV